MKIKVIIYGASGMVGKGVLLECLDSESVGQVLAVVRKPTGMQHPKLRELVITDFTDYSGKESVFSGYDACYFCLGVSSFRMSEEKYHHITYDFTLATARFLSGLNKNMSFCYVSGTGTDSTEKGRSMWARVKGKTENHIQALPFKTTFMFRPGYIQPLRGIKSKTKLYNALYVIFAPLYPLWKLLIPNYITTTTKVGLAMINSTLKGYEKNVLENRDINELAKHREE